MIEVAAITIIKQLHEKEKYSVRKISRELGMNRRTVSKYVNGGPPGYHRQKPYRSLLKENISGLIEIWLEEDQKAPVKQRRTARKMTDDLKALHGYSGSYSTVKELVRRKRGICREVFVPRAHRPGEYTEFDLGYASVDLNGQRVECALHCFQLTHSNDIFALASLKETQEEIFESHSLAFRHFDGISSKVRYDNLKQAVKKILRGKGREEQHAFVTFREQWGFEAEFCEPAKGWQKGDVEGCVGYVRRNFFSPVPRTLTLEALNEKLAHWCRGLRDTRIVFGTDKRVGDALVQDHVQLTRLPHVLPQSGKRTVGRVSHYSLVCVDQVWYSVPTEFAFRNVDVLLMAKEVVFFFKEKEMARHRRCFEKGRQIFDPVHYVPVFFKKPYALLNSKPIRELPVIFHRFFESAYAKGYGTVRDCIDVLGLLKTWPLSELEVAIELAMSYDTYHVDGIRNVLSQLSGAQKTIEKLTLPEGKLTVSVPHVDLTRYNQLIPTMKGNRP